jgi:MoaA/NifB/PqqE/SkfB family radical SAM enzyme
MKQFSNSSIRPPCGDKGRARWLSIEITYRCQNHCAWCYNPQDRKQIQELPEDVWLRLINEASMNGTEVVVFSGGEPLLIPFLVRLIDLSSDLGLLPGIVTNGELVPDIAQSLIQAGLGLVWISFLGPSAAINDSITGRKGSFDYKISAFRAFRVAVQKGHVVLMANVVVEPRNCQYVYDTIRLLADEGVQVAYVEDVVNAGNAESNSAYFLGEQEREMALIQLMQAEKDFPSLVPITRTLTRPVGDHRPPQSDFINITPDGYMTETESRLPNECLSVVERPLNEVIHGLADCPR